LTVAKANPIVLPFAAAAQKTAGRLITLATGKSFKHYFRLRFIGAAEPDISKLHDVMITDIRSRAQGTLRGRHRSKSTLRRKRETELADDVVPLED
jgi:hypothetical protein